jgi:hypothetical protein
MHLLLRADRRPSGVEAKFLFMPLLLLLLLLLLEHLLLYELLLLLLLLLDQ